MSEVLSDEVFEGNNLIEAFLGKRLPLKDVNGLIYAWQLKTNSRYVMGYVINYNELSYHHSWDALMKVVKKVNSSDIFGYGVTLHHNVRKACGDADLGAVWKACLAFINWKNNNKAKKVTSICGALKAGHWCEECVSKKGCDLYKESFKNI